MHQWEYRDGFFKATGFPRKVVDNGSLVSGKIYDAAVTYQISNNDGIKGNLPGLKAFSAILNKTTESLPPEKSKAGLLHSAATSRMMCIDSDSNQSK